MFLKKFLPFQFALLVALMASAQEDSLSAKKDTSLYVGGAVKQEKKSIDTLRPKHSPRKAAIRSAIIPGWGQVYNGKFWKVPIVYTAIGIPAYLFLDNKKWYDKTRYAYAVASYPNPSPDSLSKVDSRLRIYIDRGYTNSLINLRNEFRRNMDYSILFFLLFWSLNIVDATVDAHLKDFSVTPDVTLRIKPARVGGGYGVGLAFEFNKAKPRLSNVK